MECSFLRNRRKQLKPNHAAFISHHRDGSGAVHMTTEESENGIFTLKTRQFTAGQCLDLCLKKTRSESHVIIATTELAGESFHVTPHLRLRVLHNKLF